MALKFDNPTDTITNQTTNGDLTLSGNGTGAVVINSNVGVGIDPPESNLHVYGSSPNVRIQDDDNSGSYLSLSDDQATQAVIRKLVNVSGNTYIDLNPMPVNHTDAAFVRFFRETNTTATVGLHVHVGGNNTGVNAFIAGKNSNSFFSYLYGNVGIRTNLFGSSAVGALAIGNGTAPTSSPANSVQVYAADVSASSELFVRDEAGNVTQLSPHAAGSLEEAFPGADDKSIPLPMVVHHRNDYLGREEWIHLSKLALAVEKLTGEQFIFHRPTEERDWDADQQTARTEQQEKINEWQVKRGEWEAKNNKPYDDEEPQPYELANMPAWMRARVGNQ